MNTNPTQGIAADPRAAGEIHQLAAAATDPQISAQANSAEATTDPSADPPHLVMKVGTVTYYVNVHFSKTSKETINDKIMRLIRNDIKNGNIDHPNTHRRERLT